MTKTTCRISTCAATLGAMALLTVGALNFNVTTHAQEQRQLIPIAEAAFVLGATPDALAAAGANADDASAALQSLTQAEDERAAFANARSAERAALIELQSFKANVQSGGMTDDRAEQIGLLEDQYEFTAATRRNAEAALRAVITDSLSSRLGAESIAVLSQFNSNSGRRVPAAYRAMDLSEDGWETLERAYVKHDRGLNLTSAESSALNAAMSSSHVATVSARLNSNTDLIAQVFALAMAN